MQPAKILNIAYTFSHFQYLIGQILLFFFKGTYGHQTHLSSPSECTDCPSGKYCEGTGLEIWTGDCEAGYLCIGGAKLKAPTDEITGKVCPPGKFYVFIYLSYPKKGV